METSHNVLWGMVMPVMLRLEDNFVSISAYGASTIYIMDAQRFEAESSQEAQMDSLVRTLIVDKITDAIRDVGAQVQTIMELQTRTGEIEEAARQQLSLALEVKGLKLTQLSIQALNVR